MIFLSQTNRCDVQKNLIHHSVDEAFSVVGPLSVDETCGRGRMNTMAAEDIEICAICKEGSYRWREEVLGRCSLRKSVVFERMELTFPKICDTIVTYQPKQR